jgi:hypothetical protein
MCALRVLVACALCASCAATKDSIGGGESRLDDSPRPEAVRAVRGGQACGREGAGDLVLLDARTGGPLTCLPVTVLAEPMSCPLEADCQADEIFKGVTNPQGQAPLSIRALEKVRLVAIADGYGPSVLSNASSKAGQLLELELAPEDGFWLKVLDAEGNYLQDLSLTFKQGTEIVAQLRSNTLANVFFAQRQPFSGQLTTVEAPGFRPATIAELNDLGADGHTLTLARVSADR